MRVLVFGACPGARYSYGKVARYVGSGLAGLGYDVSYVCGDSDYEVEIDGRRFRVYPDAALRTPTGAWADSMAYYSTRLKADFVLAIGAPWAGALHDEMLTFNLARRSSPDLRKVRLVAYFSFDWFRAPNDIKATFKFPHVVAMPTEAERRYTAIPRDRFVKAPHGVNGEVFNPQVEPLQLQYQFPLPERPEVVVATLMKNHGRKNWALAAFTVAAMNTWGIRAVLLDLYTAITATQDAWNIDAVLKGAADFFPVVYGGRGAMGVLPHRAPSSAVELAHGFTEEDQARIMKAAHMHILPTRGEGFSLAVLESLALGLPNVVTDLEVLRESFGKFRSVVFARRANYYVWPSEGTFFYEPDFDDFADKAIDVAEHLDEYTEMAVRDAEAAIKEFTWERTAKAISEALERSLRYDYTMFEEDSDYMAGWGRRWE